MRCKTINSYEDEEMLTYAYDLWRGAMIVVNQGAVKLCDQRTQMRVINQLNQEIAQIKNTPIEKWEKNKFYDEDMWVVPEIKVDNEVFNSILKNESFSGITAQWNKLTSNGRNIIRSFISDITIYNSGCTNEYSLYLLEGNYNNKSLLIVNSRGEGFYLENELTVSDEGYSDEISMRIIDSSEIRTFIDENKLIIGSSVTVNGNFNDPVLTSGMYKKFNVDSIHVKSTTSSQIAGVLNARDWFGRSKWNEMIKAAERIVMK